LTPRCFALCKGCPNLSFGPAVEGVTLSHPGGLDALATGDFDEDGNPDLVVSALFLTGGISFTPGVKVVRGSAQGEFGPDPLFPMTNHPNALGVADYDGDGHLDVLGSRNGVANLALLRGNGAGKLAAPITIGTDPYTGMVGGDFNGDHRPDVALLEYPSGDEVHVFTGRGAVGFDGPFVTAIPTPGTSLLSGDFNGDGISDLLVLQGSGVTPLLGTPYAAFSPQAPVPISSPAWAVAAHFNGDTLLDAALATTSFGTESVVTLLGNGAGGFAVGPPLHLKVQGLAAGDFDGDAKIDLVGGGGEIAMLSGDGNGGFSVADELRLDFVGPIAVDVNRDGVSDVLARSSGAPPQIVRLRSALGRVQLPPTYTHGLLGFDFPNGLAPADFNRDGFPDLALTDGRGLKVLTSNSVGELTLVTEVSFIYGLGGSAAGDFNGDMKPDLAVANGHAGAVTVFLGAGDGTFSSQTDFPIDGGFPGVVFAVDLTKDGVLDLVTSGVNSIAVFIGNGDGTFDPPASYSAGASPLPAIGDFDGDGVPDVVTSNSGSNNLSILLSDGAGGFRSITFFSLPDDSSPGMLSVADFNGDAAPDVAVATSFSGLVVLYGDGAGSLGPVSPHSLPGGGSPATGDWNHDGLIDLVIRASDRTVQFFSNLGSSFAAGPIVFSNQLQRLAVADFQADGDLDVAAASNSAGTISLVLNTNCTFRHLGVAVDVPACNPSGVSFTTQPVMKGYDDGGTVVSCQAGTVAAMLAPGGGDPASSLDGTTSVPMVSGVASFSNLGVTGLGVAHRLLFLHSDGSKAFSRTFSTGVSPISAPTTVCPFSSGHSAAVLDAGAGAYYFWEIENGVITSGNGTRMITFHAGSSGLVTLHVRVGFPGQPCLHEQSTTVAIVASGVCPPPGGFLTLSPCRVVDTRDPEGPTGGPALSSGATRLFPIAGRCGIPATAKAVAVNLTVVGPSAAGFLTAFSAGAPRPGSSTINFRADAIRANNAILPLGAAGDLAIYCALGAPGSSHFLLDVSGYFE
jgi:VCBS repeat protein